MEWIGIELNWKTDKTMRDAICSSIYLTEINFISYKKIQIFPHKKEKRLSHEIDNNT